jgi:hypothetical protein
MHVIGHMAQVRSGRWLVTTKFLLSFCLISTRSDPRSLGIRLFDAVLAAQFGFRSRYCCEHEDRVEANRLEDPCRPCGEGRKQTYFVANQVP